MDKKELNLFKFVNYVCCMFLCVWFILPYLSRNGNVKYLAIVLALWVFTAIGGGIKLVFNGEVWASVLWLLLIWFYKALGISTCSAGNIFNQFYFWIVFYIFRCYMETEKKFLLFLRYFIILVMLINILDNIQLIIETPNISEIINSEWGGEYLKTNAGATAFSFLCVLYIIGVMFMLRDEKKLILRILFVFCIASGIYYIILAGRGTAFLSLMIFVVLFYFGKFFKNSMIGIIVGCISVFIVMFVILPSVIEYFIEAFPDSRTVSRLVTLANLLRGYEAGANSLVSTSGISRIQLSLTSLETWYNTVSSVIFGIGDHRATSVGLNYDVGIGNHAEFIDVFARYGLIGAVIFFKAFFGTFKSIKERSEKLTRFSFVIMLIFYGCINNITKYGSIAVMIYLLCCSLLVCDDVDEIKGE